MSKKIKHSKLEKSFYSEQNFKLLEEVLLELIDKTKFSGDYKTLIFNSMEKVYKEVSPPTNLDKASRKKMLSSLNKNVLGFIASTVSPPTQPFIKNTQSSHQMHHFTPAPDTTPIGQPLYGNNTCVSGIDNSQYSIVPQSTGKNRELKTFYAREFTQPLNTSSLHLTENLDNFPISQNNKHANNTNVMFTQIEQERTNENISKKPKPIDFMLPQNTKDDINHESKFKELMKKRELDDGDILNKIPNNKKIEQSEYESDNGSSSNIPSNNTSKLTSPINNVSKLTSQQKSNINFEQLSNDNAFFIQNNKTSPGIQYNSIVDGLDETLLNTTEFMDAPLNNKSFSHVSNIKNIPQNFPQSSFSKVSLASLCSDLPKQVSLASLCSDLPKQVSLASLCSDLPKQVSLASLSSNGLAPVGSDASRMLSIREALPTDICSVGDSRQQTIYLTVLSKYRNSHTYPLPVHFSIPFIQTEEQNTVKVSNEIIFKYNSNNQTIIDIDNIKNIISVECLDVVVPNTQTILREPYIWLCVDEWGSSNIGTGVPNGAFARLKAVPGNTTSSYITMRAHILERQTPDTINTQLTFRLLTSDGEPLDTTDINDKTDIISFNKNMIEISQNHNVKEGDLLYIYSLYSEEVTGFYPNVYIHNIKVNGTLNKATLSLRLFLDTDANNSDNRIGNFINNSSKHQIIASKYLSVGDLLFLEYVKSKTINDKFEIIDIKDDIITINFPQQAKKYIPKKITKVGFIKIKKDGYFSTKKEDINYKGGVIVKKVDSNKIYLEKEFNTNNKYFFLNQKYQTSYMFRITYLE
jgi:hypothetical protein